MRNPLLCCLALAARIFSICLLATFLFATLAVAQTQITTGTIQGTILGANV